MSQQLMPNKEAVRDRLGIIEEATDLYLTDEASFTVHNLAERLEVKPSDIYAYYPNKRAILSGYYSLMVDRYLIMLDEIENFEEYELAEKTSNFIYTSFDIMQEKREFVEETFDTLIKEEADKEFHNKVKKLFKHFLQNDPNIASSNQLLMQDIFYEFLVSQYFHLIDFWLEDASVEGEKSMAYADKMTTFLQEIMYTSVLDKGFDLFKFMAVNDKKFARIPFIGSITRKLFN